MNALAPERSPRPGFVQAMGPVQRAMSKDIVMLASDTHVGQALALMEAAHATWGLVVEAGGVIGSVAIRDLLDVRTLAWRTGTLWGPGRDYTGWRVADVMTRCESAVSPIDPLALALVKLDEGELDRLPVVDERGRLVGLLSRRDAIHALAELVGRAAVCHPG
jgi:CBS domain-containing protein